MKLNPVKTAIAVLFGSLIAYSMSFFNSFAGNLLFPIACGVESAIIMTIAMALELSWMRTMTNIKITSWLFFVALLILNLIFGFVGVSTPLFIILNGAITLIYILIVYSLGKASKED